MSKNNHEQIEQFIERMGMIAQADGLPRIAGRLMGLMVLEAGPFSFSELEQRLKVSRGSISTNTRLLENMGVIERLSKSGERQDYFQLVKAPYAQLLHGLAFRIGKAEKMVRETQATIVDEGASRRLQELADFYQNLSGTYQALIERMKEGS